MLQALSAFGNFVLTATVIFTIIGLNIAMFFKIKKRKMSWVHQFYCRRLVNRGLEYIFRSVGQSYSSQNQKVARTLTGTMIIMLIPLIVYLFVAVSYSKNVKRNHLKNNAQTGEIIPNNYLSFILYCGATANDIRVHIVTCYFYFTHPVFKKHGIIKKIDVAQKMTSQSEHFLILFENKWLFY